MNGHTYKKKVQVRSDPDIFSSIVGRTDLTIGGSKAKFDVEDDGKVHLAVAPPKSHKIIDKPSFRSKIFVEVKFWASRNETWGIV